MVLEWARGFFGRREDGSRLNRDFEGALAALASAASGYAAPPLSKDYYPVAHEAFESASDQRDLLAAALGALIGAQRFAGRQAIDFLSVGCGDGALDARLLTRETPPRLNFTGVDPNPHSLAAFRARGVLSGTDQLVEADFMAWPEERRFDILSTIHVAYYVDDKDGFIDRCLQRVRPGGLLALAVAPLSRMNRIASVFWKGQTEGEFYADECDALLRRKGLAFERRVIAASLPLSFYESRGADTMVIDFTIQTKTAPLSAPIQNALLRAIEAAAEPIDGRPALAHPVDLFVIEAE